MAPHTARERRHRDGSRGAPLSHREPDFKETSKAHDVLRLPPLSTARQAGNFEKTFFFDLNIFSEKLQRNALARAKAIDSNDEEEARKREIANRVAERYAGGLMRLTEEQLQWRKRQEVKTKKARLKERSQNSVQEIEASASTNSAPQTLQTKKSRTQSKLRSPSKERAAPNKQNAAKEQHVSIERLPSNEAADEEDEVPAFLEAPKERKNRRSMTWSANCRSQTDDTDVASRNRSTEESNSRPSLRWGHTASMSSIPEPEAVASPRAERTGSKRRTQPSLDPFEVFSARRSLLQQDPEGPTSPTLYPASQRARGSILECPASPRARGSILEFRPRLDSSSSSSDVVHSYSGDLQPLTRSLQRQSTTSFDTCSALAKKHSVSLQTARRMHKEFNTLDKLGNGYLSFDELREGIREIAQLPHDKLLPPHLDMELSMSFKEADLNGDNQISFEEFMLWSLSRMFLEELCVEDPQDRAVRQIAKQYNFPSGQVDEIAKLVKRFSSTKSPLELLEQEFRQLLATLLKLDQMDVPLIRWRQFWTECRAVLGAAVPTKTMPRVTIEEFLVWYFNVFRK